MTEIKKKLASLTLLSAVSGITDSVWEQYFKKQIAQDKYQRISSNEQNKIALLGKTSKKKNSKKSDIVTKGR